MYKYSFLARLIAILMVKWTQGWIPKDIPFYQTIFTQVPLHFFCFSSPFSFPLSLSMSSKAHYLLGSLIDYKRLVLFPRNMPVKRTEYTFPCGHWRWTENTERGSENSLSLSSNQGETLSPHLCLTVFSFIFCFPSSFCFLLSDRPSFFLILSTKIFPCTYICSPVFHAIPSFSLSFSREFLLVYLSSLNPPLVTLQFSFS